MSNEVLQTNPSHSNEILYYWLNFKICKIKYLNYNILYNIVIEKKILIYKFGMLL